MKGLRRNTLVTIVVKELVTSLRDRQTAIYTFVLPICLYPIVFWVMLQGALVIQGQKEQTEVWFAIYGANVNIDEQGNVTSMITAAGVLDIYRELCKAAGHPDPKVIVMGEESISGS